MVISLANYQIIPDGETRVKQKWRHHPLLFYRVAKIVAPKKAALKVAEGELAEAMGVRN